MHIHIQTVEAIQGPLSMIMAELCKWYQINLSVGSAEWQRLNDDISNAIFSISRTLWLETDLQWTFPGAQSDMGTNDYRTSDSLQDANFQQWLF